jgi:hypothetical protein
VGTLARGSIQVPRVCGVTASAGGVVCFAEETVSVLAGHNCTCPCVGSVPRRNLRCQSGDLARGSIQVPRVCGVTASAGGVVCFAEETVCVLAGHNCTCPCVGSVPRRNLRCQSGRLARGSIQVPRVCCVTASAGGVVCNAIKTMSVLAGHNCTCSCVCSIT